MLSFKLMTLMTMISFYVYTGVIAKGYAGGRKDNKEPPDSSKLDEKNKFHP